MLNTLNSFFPIRFTVFGLSVMGLLLSVFTLVGFRIGGFSVVVFAALVGVGIYDVVQTKRSVLRNYPIIGHLRFMLEFIRPEMRQYFLESDVEAMPFSRSQRSLVYQRAKGDSDKRPFGTQLDVHAQGYEWMNHTVKPSTVASHDFRVWIGGDPAVDSSISRTDANGKGGCTQPYHASIFNISAMS